MRNRRETDERGVALYTVVVVLVLIVAVTTTVYSNAIASKQELESVQQSIRRYYLAEAALNHALNDLNLGGTGNVGSSTAPIAFGDGEYWVTTTTGAGGVIELNARGRVHGELRGLRAAVQNVSEGIFHNAVFAGNNGGSPGYSIELSGTGDHADLINGDIYSAAGVSMEEEAQVTGTIRAGGTITGATGETEVSMPAFDAAAFGYEVNHDVNVAAEFAANEAWSEKSELGGKAFEVPENLRSHIFRKNPDDRGDETKGTAKDDYFLEDPYAAIQTGTRSSLEIPQIVVGYETQVESVLGCEHSATDHTEDIVTVWVAVVDEDGGGHYEDQTVACTHVHEAGCYVDQSVEVPIMGYPENYIPDDNNDVDSQAISLADGGNGAVYYIDGNLWIHSRKCYGFSLLSGGQGVQVTFVVKGNVYFADDLRYDQVAKDGVAFIALKDKTVPDSGNIYFGDPVFGTVTGMDAFLYAEDTFHDWNLDMKGSPEVNLHGLMAAGDHVSIHRTDKGERTRLIVNFDPRVKDEKLWLPGLPTMPNEDGKRVIPRFRIMAVTEVSR